MMVDNTSETKTLTEEDLAKIEKEMKKCAKSDKRIYREEISKEEALNRSL